MIWTADRIVHRGRALHHMGLSVAANGRIAAFAPLASLPPADIDLRGQAIFPGRLNPYHHSLGALERCMAQMHPAAAARRPGKDDAVADGWAAALTPADLYVVARAAFMRLLCCGITCVGEVHALRYQINGTPYAVAHAMLESLLNAAQDTGIRLAVIDNVRLRQPAPGAQPHPQRQSAPHLELACSDFDALVGHIIGRQDARLSWALGAHSLAAVPYDALVGLRVRLGHMPFFLGDIGSAAGPAPSLSASQALITLVKREVLDACVTHVTTAALTPEAARALAEVGATACLCLGPDGTLAQTPHVLTGGGYASVPLLASGAADPAYLGQGFADWPDAFAPGASASGPPPWTAAHLAAEMNAGAAKALGVDTGIFRPGRWADFFAMDMPPTVPGAADPDAGRPPPEEPGCVAEQLWRHLLAGPPESLVRYVVVGGNPVLRDGKHPLMATSQVYMAALAARLAQGD